MTHIDTGALVQPMPEARRDPPPAPVDAARADAGPLADLVELTKPRITRLVTVTSAMGFGMGALSREQALPAAGGVWGLLLLLAIALLGTALSSSGASALNMWWERERDALMHRTRARPVPAGRLEPGHALLAGLMLCAAGVSALWLGVGAVPALVALATIVLYVLVYTPLKPRSPLATLVGAVPGALPPLIGWTAAPGSRDPLQGLLDPGGWTLFLIMFVWQIPHFLAIAWMHREDYERGGHRVLPTLDPDGSRTAWTALLWTVTLVPVSLLPASAFAGLVGFPYVVCALALGLGLLGAAARLASQRTRASARVLLLASVLHLPLLFAALVGDAALSRLL